GTQTITFDGRVGNGLNVQSFAEFTDRAATTVFNTDVVSTVDDQNYSGTVVISDIGANMIELSADRSINFTGGAKLTTHNTEVAIVANGGGTTSGAFTGITINASTITSTGMGVLDLEGVGGNDPTTGSHDGIFIG